MRSSQMVGISATGRRRRRALAVSSRPISKPLRLSMPTSRMNSVEYALKLLVASLVPTRPTAERGTSAAGEQALHQRAAHLLAAGAVAGRGSHDHAALDQAGEVVDLARVVAAVRHRHHDRAVLRVVDAVADRVRPVRGHTC